MSSFGRIIKLVVHIDHYSTHITYDNSTIREVYSNPSGFVFRIGAASLDQQIAHGHSLQQATADGHRLVQATAFLVHHFCDDSVAAAQLMDGKPLTTDDETAKTETETETETESYAPSFEQSNDSSQVAQAEVACEQFCFVELIPVIQPQWCHILKRQIGYAKDSYPDWHLKSCVLYEYARMAPKCKCYCISIKELMRCINGWIQGINPVEMEQMVDTTLYATKAQNLNVSVIYLNAQLKRLNRYLQKQAYLNKCLVAKFDIRRF